MHKGDPLPALRQVVHLATTIEDHPRRRIVDFATSATLVASAEAASVRWSMLETHVFSEVFMTVLRQKWGETLPERQGKTLCAWRSESLWARRISAIRSSMWCGPLVNTWGFSLSTTACEGKSKAAQREVCSLSKA